MACICWGTPVPAETSEALKEQLDIKQFTGRVDIRTREYHPVRWRADGK